MSIDHINCYPTISGQIILGVTVVHMTMATTKEVIREHLPKYFIASREKKSEILDHLTAVLGMHRKAVIRALRNEKRRDGRRQKKKPGPSRLYTHDVVAALKDIWEAGNEVCGELLHPVVKRIR